MRHERGKKKTREEKKDFPPKLKIHGRLIPSGLCLDCGAPFFSLFFWVTAGRRCRGLQRTNERVAGGAWNCVGTSCGAISFDWVLWRKEKVASVRK